ncbi:MAG: type II secretion system GspH family protein [Oscillospiraceae bacterium]|nr:type II secretion system GspH family protein [Oscillospiraceae bacterium]
MKRKLKGFTLIECLVALAILGVASLTMAQIYASVARKNMANHTNNTSIAKQMEFIEKELRENGAVEIKYDGGASAPNPPSGTNIAQNSYIEVERSDGTKLTYPVDIYILNSRDANGEQSYIPNPSNPGAVTPNPNYKGPDEEKTNLKYRYFLAH